MKVSEFPKIQDQLLKVLGKSDFSPFISYIRHSSTRFITGWI
jgi:hypothetical protein